MNCEEYISFVTRTLQDEINHQYSIQSRGLDFLTSHDAEVRVDCLENLAIRLGVDLE